MKIWLAALGLLLVLVSGSTQAWQAGLCPVPPTLPDAWEDTGSVPSRAGEWLAHGAVQAEPEDGRPAKARAQMRVGCRHRNPHLGILRINPEPGKDVTGMRYGDGYIIREEVIWSVLHPGGPGPPAPVVVTYLACRDLAFSRRSPQLHFQSSLGDPS